MTGKILDLASLDYYPEGLLAKSKPEQKAHIKEIDGNWGKINTALNSMQVFSVK